MTIGWIDATAGASGDMVLGALVGAGVPVDVLQSHIDLLGLDVHLRVGTTRRAGLGATKVDIAAPDTTMARNLDDVVALFGRLDPAVASVATAVFERLAVAEAAVHATSIDDVHFHEVGALDSIADVVAAAAGFAHLELAQLHCSTPSLGSGLARSAHGPLPVPAPAVLEILRGVTPVRAGPAPHESTTPTGAALLATLVTQWGPMPTMTVDSIGMGAGDSDPDEVANVLRLLVGEADSGTGMRSQMLELQANVDDLDPRAWPGAISAVLDAGARDAWLTPVMMKKGRPAHMFGALYDAHAGRAVRAAVFRATSTIGLRELPVTRYALSRSESSVDVEGHTVRVKIAVHDGKTVNRSVEWDDVVAAARTLGRSEKDVLDAAIAAAHDMGPA